MEKPLNTLVISAEMCTCTCIQQQQQLFSVSVCILLLCFDHSLGSTRLDCCCRRHSNGICRLDGAAAAAVAAFNIFQLRITESAFHPLCFYLFVFRLLCKIKQAKKKWGYDFSIIIFLLLLLLLVFIGCGCMGF